MAGQGMVGQDKQGRVGRAGVAWGTFKGICYERTTKDGVESKREVRKAVEIVALSLQTIRSGGVPLFTWVR